MKYRECISSTLIPPTKLCGCRPNGKALDFQSGEEIHCKFESCHPLQLYIKLNSKGKSFFLDYYSQEIYDLKVRAIKELQRAQKQKDEIFDYWEALSN